MNKTHRFGGAFGCSAAALIIGAGLWLSASSALAAQAPGDEQETDQIVVTAKVSKVTTVAPVSSSLAATEPTAIITRKFMEEDAPRVGDFSTIAVFAPSMVSTPDANGAGASDGGKIAMRGFADGNYNITYDGIAWGDTNGPSHHGTAFFPNSTIGGVIIDRGPGGATDLGPANFGGSVNLLSLPLEARPSIAQVLTVGSFDTDQAVTTVQSGPVSQLNGAKFLGNFQELQTNGYLTNNHTHGASQLVKGQVPLFGDFTLTALYTHTAYFYNKSDIGDADIAQLTQYGQNFSLGNDPTLQDYYRYNWVKKKTDFEYAKLQGTIGYGLSVNDTVYSYGYDNQTESTQNNLAAASANLVTPTPGATYPALGKTYAKSLQVAGMPGYLKLNEYRVYGNILKFTENVGFGKFTLGSLVERASTDRYIFDINVLTGKPDYREKAATEPGTSGVYVDVPLNIQYNEFSGWTQYQIFSQFEWTPTENLTVTPGIKYVNWDLGVNAPVEKLSTGSQPISIDQDFTKTLPFLTANYRIAHGWSAYAQYAQGFLIPNISNLYVGNASLTRVQPQLSTNYQLGTVLQKNNYSIDADIYYILFDHKIQSFTDPVSGQPYDTNEGGATYKGFEIQGSYVLPYGASLFANYSDNRAIGTKNAANPLYNGHQLTSVPGWTAAWGVRFEHQHLFAANDDVIVTLNEKFVGSQYLVNASCGKVVGSICQAGATLTPVTGLLPSYSEAELSGSYRIGRYLIEAQVLNLFDSDSLTTMKGSALIAGTNAFATTVGEGGATNAPQYQVPRSFQITLKAKF